MSLQKATVPSDEVSSKSDCENRTLDWNLLTSKFWGRFRCSIIHNRNWKPNDMPVLGLAGRHSEKWKIDAGTQSWSGSVSPRTDSVFVGQCLSVVHCPPVQNLVDTKQNHQPNKRKFYICADGPHTHAKDTEIHRRINAQHAMLRRISYT